MSPVSKQEKREKQKFKNPKNIYKTKKEKLGTREGEVILLEEQERGLVLCCCWWCTSVRRRGSCQ
jgi:hypothetical protein